MDLVWTWLGRVADALSLVTAFVSGYAAWKIRKIGARLAFNVRADEVLERISQHAHWIDQCLTAGMYDRNQMIDRITQCRAEIMSARGGLDGDARVAAKRLEQLYVKYKRADPHANLPVEEATQHFWSILGEVKAFSIHARGWVSDQRIGGGT